MPVNIKIVALESAHTHMNSLIRQTQELEGAEFVGFADPKPEHRAQTKERSELGDNMVFAEYERLLDERQPDAAIICSTNADHVKYVEALAPRGIHIMLEKPFAASLSDADRMIAACAEAQCNPNGQLADRLGSGVAAGARNHSIGRARASLSDCLPGRAHGAHRRFR